MINLKTASYQDTYKYIEEHQTNGELVHKGITFKLDPKKKAEDNDSIRMHIGEIMFIWGGWYYKYDQNASKGKAIYCQTTPHMGEFGAYQKACMLIADMFGIDINDGSEFELKEDSVVVDERDMTIAKLEAQLEVYKRFAPTPDTVTYTKIKES